MKMKNLKNKDFATEKPAAISKTVAGRLKLFILCTFVILTACGPYISDFTPEEGAIGTEVTIKGGRFEDSPAGNTIEFGGVTVPTSDITYASSSEIRAIVPVGAQTGLISVSTPKGSGESDKNFIVPVTAEWTFMVYLDADNNLESAGIDDFLEMASVGSSTAVNIVVQMDRIDGYDTSYGDWTGTRRFLIQANDTPGGTPLQDLGEENMGDPNTLQDFVEWTVTNYRANHYILVIWNHGDGWRQYQEDMLKTALEAETRAETDWAVAKGVASDTTDGDKLYMKEVQDALTSAKQELQDRNNLSLKLDIVGFDACLMGMVETAYALRDVTNYMVGSEELEPGDGWPYDDILRNLTTTPTMTPVQLATQIVTDYGASYSSDSSGVTQSAVDISKLSPLVAEINNFANNVNDEWGSLKAARTNTRQYHSSWSSSSWGVDLWDFADEVQTRVISPTLQTAAQDLKTAVGNFVISEYHSSNMTGSHGIAIYFPPNQTSFNNDPDHTGYDESNTFMPVDFVLYSQWDNWLQDFYANIP